MNKRMTDMFARTERLLLRPGWPEDAPALAVAINDEAIVRNLARVPWPYDLEHARDFLTREKPAGEIDLLIFRRTSRAPQLIGGVGLSRMPDGDRELGYWIARRHWGLGYATEAAAAATALACSLGVRRLEASPFVDNPASGRVLAKLGFKPTGDVVHRYSAGRGASVASRRFELRMAKCGPRSNGAAEADSPPQMIAA